MTYPGTMDPGWYTRDPEELLEHVQVDDLVEEAATRLYLPIRTLVLFHWAAEWIRRYLEGMAWEGLTGRESDEASCLFARLCPAYIEEDALAELGCEARRRGEEIAREAG